MILARKLTCLGLVLLLLTPVAMLPRTARAESSPQAEPAPGIPYPAPMEGNLDHEGAYQAGAIVGNFVYVPGKAILCGLGTLTGLTLMLATFGSGYKYAKYFAEEGCGGGWILKAKDLRRANAEIARRSMGE
jgi:hypothetical protein